MCGALLLEPVGEVVEAAARSSWSTSASGASIVDEAGAASSDLVAQRHLRLDLADELERGGARRPRSSSTSSNSLASATHSSVEVGQDLALGFLHEDLERDLLAGRSPKRSSRRRRT